MGSEEELRLEYTRRDARVCFGSGVVRSRERRYGELKWAGSGEADR